MGICSLPLIFARKYDIMKNSDERQGGSIFGQKFWFNAVGKKGRISVDVLICREDVYQEYKKQDGFQETIDFPEDNMLKKKKIISYDDAHAAIMVNAQNKKMAEKFISYLEQLNHINNAN